MRAIRCLHPPGARRRPQIKRGRAWFPRAARWRSVVPPNTPNACLPFEVRCIRARVFTGDYTDDVTTYTKLTRRHYKPICPDCGSTNMHVQWVPADDSYGQERAREYIPGTHQCRDCRNCQR